MDIRTAFLAYWEALERCEDWIDLGMGMPPASLFAPVLEYSAAFTQGTQSRGDYQPQAGARIVRRAIAAFESRHAGVAYTCDNIMLVAGAIRGFSLVIDHFIRPGTSFVEILPTYPLLAGQLRWAAERFNCPITTIAPKDTTSFQLEAGEVVPYIRPSTIVSIVNPSNPTGLYIEPAVLKTIIEVCEERGAYLVVDESCDIPLTTDQIHRYCSSSPALIRLQSLSKTALLAGYRAGYIVAGPSIIEQISRRYAFSDANAPVVVNEAILTYLERTTTLDRIATISREKVANTIQFLQSCKGVQTVITPQACYYIFLKVDYSGGSWQLFRHLLDSGVNVVPGVLFGLNDADAWIRICCVRPEAELAEGLDRLQKALALL